MAIRNMPSEEPTAEEREALSRCKTRLERIETANELLRVIITNRLRAKWGILSRLSW
jgi:hypothetical protein